MCGIFGVISNENITPKLIAGLKKLEYRGYDSAGIALINQQQQLSIYKSQGKIISLEEKLSFSDDVTSNIGIAHTRWATHGKPNEINAHPHFCNDIAVVHNGIIENYKLLREKLQKQGYIFKSDTDTEVIPCLIDSFCQKGQNILDAITNSIKEIEGAFALAILYSKEKNKIFVAKRSSPLAIGKSTHGKFIASDAYAMADATKKICYLEDGDIAEIALDNITIYDAEQKICNREFIKHNMVANNISKENYRHFMLKEINEQPLVAADIMNSYCNRNNNEITFHHANYDFSKAKIITFVACGSSYYAALIAKNWFENIADIDCKIEIASEFLYINHFEHSDLVIFISQSGETADTLKSLEMVKKTNIPTLVISNVARSSMALAADNFVDILAGPEIGVASTKAFTAQLIVLALIALKSATQKNIISKKDLQSHCRALRRLPNQMALAIQQEDNIQQISMELKNIHNILYIGRGAAYGLAKEAALKLQELSYIHAEGIAAGELKHGPIALIDEDLFIISLLPQDKMFYKTLSNLQEINARGGKIITITAKNIKNKISDITENTILMPEVDEFTAAILYTIPVQLIAYHVALLKGTDVDQPRNLAKSVTVE